MSVIKDWLSDLTFKAAVVKIAVGVGTAVAAAYVLKFLQKSKLL